MVGYEYVNIYISIYNYIYIYSHHSRYYIYIYIVYIQCVCRKHMPVFSSPIWFVHILWGAQNPASCGMWFTSQPRLRHKVTFLRTMGQGLELLVGPCDEMLRLETTNR